MAEWLKAQHWKCCLGAILTRVRISLSPPSILPFFQSIPSRETFWFHIKPVQPKGFTTFYSVCKKHTQNSSSGRFLPENSEISLKFWLFLTFFAILEEKIEFLWWSFLTPNHRMGNIGKGKVFWVSNCNWTVDFSVQFPRVCFRFQKVFSKW